jgi:hypothetical protein
VKAPHSTAAGLKQLAALVAITVASACGSVTEETITPLPQAHAHNDYLHDRPLLDALDHGFCSVEADVHLVGGALLVAHDLDKTDPSRTLQSLYLDPLLARAKSNDGRVYPDGPEFTLLIDFKSDGAETYRVLQQVLEPYIEMLTEFDGNIKSPRAVSVIISGNRPVDLISANTVRHVAIDGRPVDLDDDPPASLYPLISQNWTALFEWRGEPGAFSENERVKLRSLVDRAHSQGRRIRLWATPESPVVWQELEAAGIDHINTDHLEDLQNFLLHETPETAAR